MSTWLFLRLLGLVYVLAFGSLAGQLPGLIGHDGILPADEYLRRVSEWAESTGVGIDRYRLVPTIFWLGTGDRLLQGTAYVAAALGALVALEIAPIVLLPILWALYLSLTVVCGEFLSYQWDGLLLETGLLACFIAPPVWRDRLETSVDPPPIARWLLWWLTFRLMIGSGIVKLASGDPTWRDLTALSYHYETQPLPTPIAWYVAKLPLAFHRASTASVLVVEFIAPLFIFGRRRAIAAIALIGLQAVIALTGNYGFFNLLSAALCLTLLDDRALGLLRRTSTAHVDARPTWRTWASATAAVITLPVSAAILAGQIGLPGPSAVAPLYAAIDPLRSVNPYGLFAVMTTRRLEIEVEGSLDGEHWEVYEFRHKPDALNARPTWVAPIHPRLDWQMWFAALGRYDEEVWFQRFSERLRSAAPPVMALLERHPFGGKPPRFVRATLYQYRFTDWRTGRETGNWWTRERLGAYSP